MRCTPKAGYHARGLMLAALPPRKAGRRRTATRLAAAIALAIFAGGYARAGTISANSSLAPTSTVNVGVGVSGIVQAVSCDMNTVVKKGQICAQIDPRPYERAVDAARANLAYAVAQVEQIGAALANAKLRHDRNLTLVERGVVARAVFEDIKSNYEETRARSDTSKAAVDQRRAELATAELNLGYAKIASPIDGVVLERRITVGEGVAAYAQPSGVFVIASDLARLSAMIRVNEVEVAQVKKGDRASLTVRAFPGRKFAGTVELVGSAPEPGSTAIAYEVIVAVDNADLALKPGMSALVEIDTGRK